MGNSEALKRYHASRTPEQKAAWREKVSLGTSVGMDQWHASRTPEHRELARQRIKDARLCRIFVPNQRGNRWQKGRKPVGNTTETALAKREFTKVRTASVKRILKDIVETQPELIRDAIIEGLLAPPPRSFPYIALAAAYLDGKPIDAEPPVERPNDLSELTTEQLLQRAVSIATRMSREAQERAAALTNGPLPVIDVHAMPEGDK